MSKFKRSVDKYYEANWSRLVGIAGRVLRKLKRDDLADSLVTESYLYVTGKQAQLEALVMSGGLDSVVVNWINRQSQWTNTPWRRDFVDDDRMDVTVHHDPEWEESNLEYEHTHAAQYDALSAVVAELGPVDRRLYELVFVDGHDTSGKLAKVTGLSRTATWSMIKSLKEKLKREINARTSSV